MSSLAEHFSYIYITLNSAAIVYVRLRVTDGY